MRAVNRLDRNTSGLVLVARNRRASAILSGQMKKREIGKEYIALVEGVAPYEFLIETYIKRKGESVIERMVCNRDDDGAEYSYTTGNLIKKTDKNTSLVSLIPHTGRTHQLRVHLSYLGFPIVDDELYGNGCDDVTESEKRHMLHCSALEFTHPTTGERVRFSSVPSFE
jgi:23S rRNA pseudouridine1911/1915/1917 synthase